MLFYLSQSQQLFSSWLKPSLQYRTFLKQTKKNKHAKSDNKRLANIGFRTATKEGFVKFIHIGFHKKTYVLIE